MAAVDYFLKIEGIDGESQDAKHKNEIQIESFSWGASQLGAAGHGGGGGAGKVSMHDISFTMKVSKASPKLFLACCTGSHIKSATLVARKAGKTQQEYLTVKLSDLLVSSFQEAGSQGDVVPLESISLNFTKIEVDYKEQKADGSVGGSTKVGYDVKQNKQM